ncbi:hypothetical protein RA265_27675, partial [Pseudomonas syringae pv. tagetis]
MCWLVLLRGWWVGLWARVGGGAWCWGFLLVVCWFWLSWLGWGWLGVLFWCCWFLFGWLWLLWVFLGCGWGVGFVSVGVLVLLALFVGLFIQGRELFHLLGILE